MKTGGTLNFLKKAGAVLMLVAVFASSCNKYADDFKQLNTKLDALATQVAGVTTLSTSLTALTAQVTALQTAVAGLPNPTASLAALTTNLASVNTKIDAITTSLNNVATAGTATKAVVDGLKTDLAALATKVAADDAALTTQIAALASNDVDQSAALVALKDQNTAMAASIATLQASLNGLAMTGSASDTATALTIQGLQLMLNAQKLQLDQILANSSMFIGSVSITSDAEVDFYMPKLAQLGMINGNLTVSTANITKIDNMNTILSKITAVIGTSTVSVTAAPGKSINLSKLVSVVGSFSAVGANSSSAAVAQSTVDMSALQSVTGDVTMDFDGPYASTALTTVGGNLYLMSHGTASSPTRVGTTTVDFPAVAVTGVIVSDGTTYVLTTATPTLVYDLATKVVIGGNFASLSAAVATSVKISTPSFFTAKNVGFPDAVLTINAPKATVVDLSAVKTVGKTTSAGLNITTADAGTVDLSNFANYVTSTPTTIAIPVTIEGPEVITLPKYVAGALTSSTALTVTLAKHEWAIPATLASVETLTLGSLNNAFVMPTTVVTASITGKTQSVYTSCNATVNASTTNTLESLTLGGVLKSALVTSTGLTSLTTSGVVNELGVVNCTNSGLTTLGLAHTHFPSGPGSSIVVTGNSNLASLKTSTDYPWVINISGNVRLASLDLTSNVNAVSVAGASFTVGTNKLSGLYVPSVKSLGSDPFVEAKIKSNVLLPIKAIVKKTTDATADGGYNLATPTLSLDLLDASTSSGNQNLSTLMQANRTQANLDNVANAGSNPTVVDLSGAIDTKAEVMLLIAE